MTPSYTVPKDLTTVYGQTLANVALPPADNGVWTWADSTTSVGSVGTKSFKAVFTPNDTNNYKIIETDVSVNVAPMEAGELVHVIADCHIYDRHIPVIKELISRKPYPAPTVKLNPEIKDFYKFTTDDLIVENYETWPQIKNIPIAV